MGTEKFFQPELQRYHFGSETSWLYLSESDRELLSREAKSHLLRKNQILFEQGSVAQNVYVLMKGKVKAYQSNRDGSNQILFIYVARDMFGYRPILANENQPLSVAALETSEFLVIGRERFLYVLEESPTLSKHLLISLSKEFSILANRINNFTQRSTRERLALALLLLQEKYEWVSDSDDTSTINLKRSDLADYVGTSLETLVRILTEFKAHGLVSIDGKNVKISDRRRLLKIAAID